MTMTKQLLIGCHAITFLPIIIQSITFYALALQQLILVQVPRLTHIARKMLEAGDRQRKQHSSKLAAKHLHC
jgi:hypothetical protein